MAVVTRLSDSFTDPEGLPVLLHGVGVDGTVGRWLPLDVSVADNNVAQTLPSRPTGQPITTPSANTTWPTKRDISGIKVLDFDGNDALVGGTPGAMNAYRSCAAVIRRPSVDSGTHIMVSGGSPTHWSFGVNTSNQFAGNYVGGGVTVGAPWSDTFWHFVGWSGSLTDQVMVFDGNAYSNTGDVASAASNLWLGYAGYAAVYGKFQIAELITWSAALSASQFADVRQAMIDRYGAALGLS